MAKKKTKASKAKIKKVSWDQEKCLAHMRERYGTQSNWARAEVYMTAHEVEEFFGRQCEDFDPGCGTCKAWLEWNETGKVTLDWIERDDLLKLMRDK